MHYTYVLSSEKDGRFYIGATGDLRNRLKQHTQGRVSATAYRRPLQLAYYEACHSPDDAYRRERYLKSGRGGRYLKQRLATWLSRIRDNKLERH
ncbi:MAG: GIY-YIG nuclease family protein [Burkholderiales bacterium]